MWKSWNPFRRKSKEDVDHLRQKVGPSSGKENEIDSDRASTSSSENSAKTLNGNSNNDHADFAVSDGRSSGSEVRQVACGSQFESSRSSFHSLLTSREDEHHDGLLQSMHSNATHGHTHGQFSSAADGTRQPSLRNRTGMGLHEQLNTSVPVSGKMKSPRRPITTPLSDARTRSSSRKNGNQSFTGVHGPLLSSPLVPKVRRALETSAGLRSPQLMTSSRGRPVGRSVSLSYGSIGSNPRKSTAGQVPWVRLKRRESIGLADIVSGNTPQSPNTVKLAAPEQRLLPAAPSFKTTPLIVTTEPSRARVVDTQTVVSALREKRKRFGANQHDESISDGSWINAAKRRRQDSSQSNASSVSIPPMPDSLPNLMGTPGTSLLHIENLTDQRPSTVPAVDAFITHHQREIGLGGDMDGLRQQQPVYHPQQQQQQQISANKNNSKAVLHSIQSSLSSSLRARTNMAMLQQKGVDLKRIRQMPQSQDTTRRMSFSSDISMADESIEEPPAKKSVQTPQQPTVSVASTPPAAPVTTVTTTSQSTSSTSTNGTVSTPVKRKIAEGVVLRKHNLSMGITGSPVKPLKALPPSSLVTTNDFERDRQKEYQRRVLDMLDSEESSENTGGKGTTSEASVSITTTTVTTTVITAATALPPPVSSLSQGIGTSPSVTSVPVSSSLASLNKLVQSTTTTSQPSPSSLPGHTASIPTVTAANTLSQLLKPDEASATTTSGLTSTSSTTSVLGTTLTGKPLASPASFSFGVSSASSHTPATLSAATTTTPSAARGLMFNIPASSSPQSGTTPTTSTGFQISFKPASTNIILGIGSSSAASTPPAASPPSSSQPGPSSGIQFGLAPGQSVGTTSGTISTITAIGPSSTAGQQAPTLGSVFGLNASQAKTTQLTAMNPSAAQVNQAPPNTSLVASNQIGTGRPDPASSSQPGTFSFTQSSVPQTINLQGTIGNTPGQITSATSTPSLGFSFANTKPSSTTVTTTTQTNAAPVSFSFAGLTGTPSQAPGFNFGQATAQPTFGFGLNSSTTSAITAATTAAPPAFSFGAPSTISSTVSQPQGAFGFGVSTAQNASNPTSNMTSAAGLPAPTFSTVGSGFASQLTSSGFKGFGTGAQTNAMAFTGNAVAGAQTNAMAFTGNAVAQPQNLFTGLSSQPSVSVPNQTLAAPGFGTGAQSTPQNQQFGVAAPPAYSAFATTTVNTGTFAFGQSPTTVATPSPFAFGTAATQPATTNQNPFGGPSGATPAPPPSMFGTGATTTSTSIFGSGPAPAFGSAAATTPFGSSAPVTSPPAFGSSAGMSTFGTPATSANQTVSVFGANGSSSGQPFTFGMSSQPNQQQQPPAFGSGSSTGFGGLGPSAGTSVFGAKPAAPTFGTPTAVTGPVFGAPGQTTTTTTTTSLFGTSGFQGSASQQPRPFGATTSGFGTGAAPAFGASGQNSVFGSASPFGAQTNTNPQTASPSPFGNTAAPGGVSVFGAGARPNPFGATTTTPSGFNFSAGQPQQSNAFGAQSANTASGGFNFGQAAPQPASAAASAGPFNMTGQSPARPPFQSPTPGGFNFAAAAGATPTFNFSGTPGTPNMFTPPTAGSARPRAAAKRATRRGGMRR